MEPAVAVKSDSMPSSRPYGAPAINAVGTEMVVTVAPLGGGCVRNTCNA